ncbi:MAG: L-aspartate oxidase [Desulfobacterales bacterium]|nr:L-aspartate oxidase [Desulfobacterales bacterium]
MTSPADTVQTDFLIIGSGIAGLRAALELSRRGKSSVLVTKSKIEDSNTYYAQGGIAAVDPDRVKRGLDSFESHIQDTLIAGDGLCQPNVVRNFVYRAFPDAVAFLIRQGVEFSTLPTGEYVLHQEGGHGGARIYCRGDYTGQEIEDTLADVVRNDPNIKVFENHTAVNLITRNRLSKVKLPRNRCLGAYILDRNTGIVRTFQAHCVFLATGGAGRAFLYTSNPENATGDGIAMAYRAGAQIGNIEFFQFHPTVLYELHPENPAERRFLLTEALRGEAMGGILTLEKDSTEDFVLKYDPRGSHGTRDIVARAIDIEMKKNRIPHVWLNVTPEVTGKSKDYLIESFPKIHEHCLKKGIDITKQAIPVIPAAHYTCGGVVVNECGQTHIDGLYAIGEVAYTGLMGANRLASNSLSEGALYGKLAVDHALTENKLSKKHKIRIPEWRIMSVQPEINQAMLNRFWDTTRATMMDYCSIERNEFRLRVALDILEGLVSITNNIYWHFYPTHEIIELRNLTLVAKLIVESALYRNESRGGHYRSDYPVKDDDQYLGSTILQQDSRFHIESIDRC